jgi:hypothetical protein
MALERLPEIILKAAKAAGDDPDAQAALVEVQARMLGVSVAMMTRDDTRAANDLLEGAAQYALESAASIHAIHDLLKIVDH